MISHAEHIFETAIGTGLTVGAQAATLDREVMP